MALDLRPVAGALGAEVHGVHLGSVDDAGFAEVRAALAEHLVLFFPDQHLTHDEHAAFGARWGEVEIHQFLTKVDDDHPEIVVLDSETGGKADVWHTDVTFRPDPPICSILQMRICPPVGGDTMWANLQLAYDELSTPIRELCDGLTAIHSAAGFGQPGVTHEHPVVRVHPETGRRALYVNPVFTRRIPQLRPAESRALLSYLYEHAVQPQFTCRYRWAEGTIGIWDNRVTQHYAVDDYGSQRRIERVTVLGDRPEGNDPRWEHFPEARLTQAERTAMLLG